MPLSECPACRLPSSAVFGGLPCAECRSALLVAPEICARCLGFACPAGGCARPWLAVDGEDGAFRFDGVAGAYLSVGPGARVLKTWKTAPSPALDRYLRTGVRAKLALRDPARPLFLVPVPQSPGRRWALAGGSVLRLCAMIREIRRNAADRTLDLLEIAAAPSARQAETRGEARYSRRASFRARAIRSHADAFLAPADLAADPALVLVDDFLTSGSTLRAAAAAAREALESLGGFGGRRARLEVFVLGFRPALFGERDE